MRVRVSPTAPIIYKNWHKVKVGKILIDQPYPFGLIKVIDPNIKEFENTELLANNKKCKILKSV